jgi:thiosulfate/3-mercaptopyruvate sulfurtransferase
MWECMKYIVNPEWVFNHLENNDVRVIDCRFDLNNPQKGFNGYLEGHIPGALYFDLEKDLSGSIGLHGGRHPMPDITDFKDKLSAAGIDQTVTVVVYDDQGGPFASRFVWMLSYLGHEKVHLLNGGFSAWVGHDYQISTEIPAVAKKEFQPSFKPEILATIDEVKGKLHQQETTIIIDSREGKRYQGLNEPIDKIAGHIPSAVNYFWKDVIEKSEMWKAAEGHAEWFKGLPVEKEIIVYCGSCVTACPNFILLKEAGYQHVKLYAGSWSDWISYENNPIEKSNNI